MAILLLGGAIAILGWPLVDSASAASSCKEKKRDLTAFESYTAHTTVKNRTKDLTFYAEIFRHTSNLKEKKKISPGEDASAQMSFSDAAGTNIVVHVYKSNDMVYGVCSFYVTFPNDKTTLWSPYDPLCGGMVTLCNTCTVSCSKSFNPDKNRWNTYFTITD
jgi:hypothetical protein